MSNIPTAEEFIQNYNMEFNKDGKSPLVHMLIEFAKLHCETQLKAILEKAEAINKAKFKGDCNPQIDEESNLHE